MAPQLTLPFILVPINCRGVTHQPSQVFELTSFEIAERKEVLVVNTMARAIGRSSTSYQTPRMKGRSRFFGLGKMLGGKEGLDKKLGKVGKRMLGPVSYGSRGVSSYLNSPAARRQCYLKSPATRRMSYLSSPSASRRRRSGINYMAELTEYREEREVRWVKEGEESSNGGQGS